MRAMLLLFFLLPFTLLAQENESSLIRAKVKKGSLLLGGTINGSFAKVTDEISSPVHTLEGTKIQAQLRLKDGYFVQNDFAVGLDITLNHQSEKMKAADDASERLPFRQTLLLAGPFARYYLDNGVFFEATVGVGLLNFSSGEKNDLMQGDLGIGYAFFVNERYAIEPQLSFRYFRQVQNDKAYTSLGPFLGVGFQAYLYRKRANVIKRAL
ncbi:autotransporter outer membrane beta-barrel domain-containing protein [Pontibacter chitinilyticus]|uniref:autotransporter outer membrane beta-barrel domain-containing protein n=1 Tax=Pontibacter chitinilyticus TaxID=2674989 RepID=UPI00321A2076